MADAARRGITLHELGELYIDVVLEMKKGRKGETARALGIDRKTLYRRRSPRS